MRMRTKHRFMKPLAFVLPLAAAILSCSDDDRSFAVAAQCECAHEWEFADGATQSESYSAAFYCFESPSEWELWVAEEVAICNGEAYPEAVARECWCACDPTLAC